MDGDSGRDRRRDAELAAIDDFFEGDREGGVLCWRASGDRQDDAVAGGSRAADEAAARLRPAARARRSCRRRCRLIGAVYDEGRDELPQPQQRALEAALCGAVGARMRARSVARSSHCLRRSRTGRRSWSRSTTCNGSTGRRREDSSSPRAGCRGSEALLARRTSAEPPLGLERGSVVRIEVGPLSLGALHHCSEHASVGTRPAYACADCGDLRRQPFFALEIARSLGDWRFEAARFRCLRLSKTSSPVVWMRSLRRARGGARGSALSHRRYARACPPGALEEAEAAGVLVVERDRIASRIRSWLAVYGRQAALSGSSSIGDWPFHRRSRGTCGAPCLSASPPDEGAARSSRRLRRERRSGARRTRG